MKLGDVAKYIKVYALGFFKDRERSQLFYIRIKDLTGKYHLHFMIVNILRK